MSGRARSLIRDFKKCEVSSMRMSRPKLKGIIGSYSLNWSVELSGYHNTEGFDNRKGIVVAWKEINPDNPATIIFNGPEIPEAIVGDSMVRPPEVNLNKLKGFGGLYGVVKKGKSMLSGHWIDWTNERLSRRKFTRQIRNWIIFTKGICPIHWYQRTSFLFIEVSLQLVRKVVEIGTCGEVEKTNDEVDSKTKTVWETLVGKHQLQQQHWMAISECISHAQPYQFLMDSSEKGPVTNRKCQ